MTALPESRDEVIRYASSFGHRISGAQLARWHRAGLLPRPRQRPLGRGRGTETIYQAGTSVQVVALCQIKAEEHRLDRIAFRLWWEGFEIDPEVIRSQLVAIMRPVDEEFRQATPELKASGALDAVMRRGLGRARLEAMVSVVSQAASGTVAPVTISWESLNSWPPSLDDVAALLSQAVAAQLSGKPITTLIAEASDEDLLRARNRSRSLLAFMRSAAGPLAWLYGKGGSFFRLMDRALCNMTPLDYAGIVAMMLVFAPLVRPETLASIDTGTEPSLAHELRQIMVIRDQVPGAAQVFTPMAIRALFRDKEAARNYRPRIEKFVAEHSEEIKSALASTQPSASG